MSMKPCPTCRHQVSIRAVCCPNCGETEIDRKRPFTNHTNATIIKVGHSFPASITYQCDDGSVFSTTIGSKEDETTFDGWMTKVLRWYQKRQNEPGPHVKVTFNENNKVTETKPLGSFDDWYAEVWKLDESK